jgi:predicted nucleic acid-binding protein
VILVDTGVLIDPPLRWPAEELGASVLALAELHFGIQTARDPASRSGRVRTLAYYASLFDWLPFDEASAEAYGVLAAHVTQTRPAHARSKDILMASQAFALGVPLLTRNPKDFELVNHLVEIRKVP